MSPLFYHRAPNLSINPDSQIAPKLGSIFPNLKKLTGPLNQQDTVSIPADFLNSSSAENFQDSVTRNVKASIGVHAELAQGLPLKSDIIFNSSKDKNHIYKCSRLETTEFDPTHEYILQCIHASTRVQNYIQDCFVGRKKVYMVTGLKIAEDFSLTISQGTEWGPSLDVTADGIVHGVPASAGPQLDLSVGTSRDLAFGDSPRIVLAYRAVRIRPRHDGTVGYKDIKGGAYGLGGGEDEDTEWVIEGLEADEFPGETLETVKVEVMEDGVWVGREDGIEGGRG